MIFKYTLIAAAIFSLPASLLSASEHPNSGDEEKLAAIALLQAEYQQLMQKTQQLTNQLQSLDTQIHTVQAQQQASQNQGHNPNNQ